MQQRERAVNVHRRMPRVADIYGMLDEWIRVTTTDGKVSDGLPASLEEAVNLMSEARSLIGRAQALSVRAILEVNSDCWPDARIEGIQTIQRFPQSMLRGGDTTPCDAVPVTGEDDDVDPAHET